MPWVKMYIDFLDDPKIGRLSDRQKLRFMQLILIAGECDMDGMLVNGDTALKTEDIAWRIRADEKHVFDDIAALHAAGLVDISEAINVVNFSKRQGRSQEERRAQWRESKRRVRGNPHDVHNGVQQESNESPVGVQLLEESREDKIREEERRGESGASAPAPPPADPPSKPRKQKPEPKQTDNYRPIFGWLQEFCQMNAPQRIGKAAKHIDDSGATLNACEKFARWWQTCDWRGQKGHQPTPEQVWAEWPKAVAWDGSTRPYRKPTPGANGRNDPGAELTPEHIAAAEQNAAQQLAAIKSKRARRQEES